MAKETTKDTRCEHAKNTKPKRKTKLERTTEAQLFLEQDELQKQLEAEEHHTEASEHTPTEVESTSAEVHEQHTIVCEQRIIRRLRKL